MQVKFDNFWFHRYTDMDLPIEKLGKHVRGVSGFNKEVDIKNKVRTLRILYI